MTSIVSGLPLYISLPDEVNFGNLLFGSKYPIHIFFVESLGTSTYTVWLTHESSNFQLSESKVVIQALEKLEFYLQLAVATPRRIKDELVVLGSQSGLTKDTVELKRVTIKANIVKSALMWSKDNVIFDIKLGDQYDKTCFGNSCFHFSLFTAQLSGLQMK